MVRPDRECFEKEDVRLSFSPILDQLCDFEGVTGYLWLAPCILPCAEQDTDSHFSPLITVDCEEQIGKYLWLCSGVYKNEE